MQRAESYAALAPLLSAQLRRGVVTNCFLSTEDYQRELPRGLYYEEREGCLLLLRQRSGHFILNFYLQPGGTFFLPDVKKPVVTELSCRAKDADAMSAAATAMPFCARNPAKSSYLSTCSAMPCIMVSTARGG